jgi:catechol 2,3-dioxygenase-like lactoylglutathione lyase family enzyme
MRITGIDWILAPTRNFQQSVTFFRDVMGMTVTDDGIPVTDTQFCRYAQFKMPNGVVLEIVEPNETLARLYHSPIVSITVDDVAQARRELESRQIEFLTPILDTRQGSGWTYFRAPDGNVYQLQGPYGSPSRPMEKSVALHQAHLRVARPSDDLAAVVEFYRDGLGFEILYEFKDHEGFDGVMMGHKGAGYHLEFTRRAGHQAGRAPTADNLLVFYLPDADEWKRAVARMAGAGYNAVKSFNPYWDKTGRTFEDPDGYRIVLENSGTQKGDGTG